MTWQKRDTLFSHSYFRLAASAHGMSASELLSSRLMFPTPLASDKSTCKDAANLDVFLSDNGIFRNGTKTGPSGACPCRRRCTTLTPAASEGYRSTLKPEAFGTNPRRPTCRRRSSTRRNRFRRGGAEPGVGGMAHGLPPGMDGRILWAAEPEGVPRITEDTKDRATAAENPGQRSLPAPGLSHFSLHFHDRDRGLRQHLPYGGGDG